jgi:hypothetical protein
MQVQNRAPLYRKADPMRCVAHPVARATLLARSFALPKFDKKKTGQCWPVPFRVQS